MTGGLRIDKWLWQARFFRSRSLSAAVVAEGEVTVNGTPVDRGAHPVKPGDTVAFPVGRRRRAVLVLALGERRGPAVEARALYRELEPPPDPAATAD